MVIDLKKVLQSRCLFKMVVQKGWFNFMVASSRKLNIWFHLQGNAPIPDLRYVTYCMSQKPSGQLTKNPQSCSLRKHYWLGCILLYTVICQAGIYGPDQDPKISKYSGSTWIKVFEKTGTESDWKQSNFENVRLIRTDRSQNLCGPWISGVKRLFQTFKQGSRHSNDMYVL